MTDPYWSMSSNQGWYDSGDDTKGMFADHLQTWNCLFADGHVKSMKPVATMTPVNMWGRFDDQSGPGSCGFNTYDSDTENDEFANVNCDQSSTGALAFVQQLQDHAK